MKTRGFYQQMLGIAIPVALQTLLTSFLNTLDTIMIASLGDARIAGVGLANQVFFLFTLICFGINTGSAVLFAQYWGKRDSENVQRVNQISLSLSVGIGVLFTIAGVSVPHWIVSLFIRDAAVIQAGGDYLRVAALTYIITAVSFALGNALRTTGSPKTPLVATMISFVTNAFFNYVFIFGKLGFPELGVVGAALGTLVARIVEIFVLTGVIHYYSGPIKSVIRHWLPLSRDFIHVYWKTTFPVIINEGAWALGQVCYSAAYAMVGTQATAAVQVAMAVQNLAYVVVRGLGSSCTIMIGNSIGRNKIDRAKSDARRFIWLAIGTGVVVGGIESLTPQWTLLMFGSLSPEVFDIGAQLLHLMGMIFIFKALNSIIIVGILRGGGDTTVGMQLELACVWFVGVPLALIAAGIFHWPVTLVVLAAGMEDIVKAFFGLRRVYSDKWVHRLV